MAFRRLASISHRTAASALSNMKWEGRRLSRRMPVAADLEAIRRERSVLRAVVGGGGMCHRVAAAIDSFFGWPMIHGTYLSREGEVVCGAGHCWNVLPDGSFLDATADQWCEGGDVETIASADPDYLRYRIAFSSGGIFPGCTVSGWPELPGTAWDGRDDTVADDENIARRGHAWWTPDAAGYRRIIAAQAFLYAAHGRSGLDALLADAAGSGPHGRLAELARTVSGTVGRRDPGTGFGAADGDLLGSLAAEGADCILTLSGKPVIHGPSRAFSRAVLRSYSARTLCQHATEAAAPRAKGVAPAVPGKRLFCRDMPHIESSVERF